MARRLAFAMDLDSRVFALHAQDNGWTPGDAESAGPPDEDRPAQQWQVPGGHLHFVDDTVIRVQYVDIAAEPAQPVEDAVKAEFTCYDKDDCLEVLNLDDPEETVCRALRLLTATAPGEFDPRVLQAAQQAMRDEREEVRVTALMISVYTMWQQFVPEISRLADGDPSPRVRRFADSYRFGLQISARAASSE
jgi:hypothetical protein